MKQSTFVKKSIYPLSTVLLLIVMCAFSSCKNSTEYIYRSLYTVSFYPNGGTGTMEEQSFKQGEEQALSKNAFLAPQGRVFAGWTTDKGSKTKVYDDNQYVKITKNLKLYALWKMDEGSGDAKETKEWPFEAFKDTSIRPGDDFYRYVAGSWEKDPNGVGVWNKTHQSDDKGFLDNWDQVCIDFLDDMFSKDGKYNKDYPLFKRTAELFPETDEQFSENVAVIKKEMDDVDAIKNTEEFRKFFAKKMLAKETIFAVNFWFGSRNVKKSEFYIMYNLEFFCNLASKPEEFNVETFSASPEQVELFKIFWGITNEEEEKEFFQRISSFLNVLLFSDEAVEETNTALEDAFSDYSGIPEKITLYENNEFFETTIKKGVFRRLNLVSEERTDGLSLENAKYFLKMFIAFSKMQFLFDKEFSYFKKTYAFPLMKAFKDVYDPDGGKKEYVENMCIEIKEKFLERLENNTWMTSSSKRNAIKKAEDMYFISGYMDFIPELMCEDDYSKYNTYIELYEAINTQYWLAQIKRFYDETIPLKVRLFENSILSLENPIWRNAYYERYTNMFVILMPNFCDPMLNENYADAYNYAALGTVIGHELCHGFDAEGAIYNEKGETKEWWTISDKLRYEDKKQQMKQLFNMFTLESDSTINVNGEQTLDENLADLGGLTTVYDLFVSKKMKEGFSGEELIKQKKMFFESYVLRWTNCKDAAFFEDMVKTNEHSPFIFRVNGQLPCIDDWYDLYDVQSGDRYYLAPEQRIILW